jgi:LPS sulfotransferase NodH
VTAGGPAAETAPRRARGVRKDDDMTGSLSVFVCSTPRSGSSLLTDLLSSSQVMGGVRIEYFNPYVEQQIFQEEGPFPGWTDYLGHAPAAGTTANGVFGTKIHADNLVYLMYQLRRAFPDRAELDDVKLMGAVFPGVNPARSFVYIWRQQVLEQAVSLMIAEMRGSWNDTTPVRREPVYDRSGLIRAYWTLMQQHSAWQDWFARHRITPLPVQYERLVSEREAVLAEVFRHVGVARPPGVELSTVRRRQATDLNARWVAQLAADMARQYPFPFPVALPAPAFG